MTRAGSLLSPEAEFLVLTAGGLANDAPLRRLLDSGLDWRKVAYLAQAEGAASIVWRWLQRIGARSMAADVATAWRRLAMVSEFQSLQLERRLHEAVQALSRRGITVMLLKGSALARVTYASFAERPMTDVDLLVRPEHAQEAWLLLRANGWTWPSARWRAEVYVGHHHLPPLVHAHGEGCRLELHTELFAAGHPFRLSGDTLWLDATTACLNGETVLVPSPGHQFLHLCIHFAWSHMMQWGGWRTFRDVAALIRGGEVAWAKLIDLARESRSTTCCFWTLRLARALTNAPVPDYVLRALRPPLPELVQERLQRHYVLQLFATESSCPSTRLGRRLWELGIAPRRSEHGVSRPWRTSWGDSRDRLSPSERGPERVRDQARHLAASLSYLYRIAAPHRFAVL